MFYNNFGVFVKESFLFDLTCPSWCIAFIRLLSCCFQLHHYWTVCISWSQRTEG